MFVGVLCLSLFCYALICVLSSFAIILKRKRKLVALLLLSYICIVTVNVMWVFLTVHRVGLQYVIVVFPEHTNFFIPVCPLKSGLWDYSVGGWLPNICLRLDPPWLNWWFS